MAAPKRLILRIDDAIKGVLFDGSDYVWRLDFLKDTSGGADIERALWWSIGIDQETANDEEPDATAHAWLVETARPESFDDET